jgi:hypothetical protein
MFFVFCLRAALSVALTNNFFSLNAVTSIGRGKLPRRVTHNHNGPAATASLSRTIASGKSNSISNAKRELPGNGAELKKFQ